ncbi:MAG TPA: hypothetical protein VFZ61_06025, partial [Polyangiales bacterium]
GASVRWSVQAHAGCLMVAALPDAGVEAELLLLDGSGSVLARNEGRRGLSTVFGCAPAAAPLEVVVRGHAGAGPVSVWLAREEGS